MDFALTSLTTDCQSCYKCIRKCPTKSISFQNGRATIIPEECVLCGRCYLTCPQNCKKIRDDTALAKAILHENKLVYASVAPSFLAAFPGCSFASFRKALLGLGFSEVEETAIGATIVKQKYDELCDDGKHDVIISTCCHSINLLIEKHYPQASKYLANVLSPMLAHAADIKRRHPEAKVIFFGPCISKKNEVEMYPGYDELALTFLELEAWLKETGIVLPKDDSAVLLEESKARLFPIDGGILATMAKDNPDFTYLSIGGMEQAMQAIENILQGNVHHAFIEMSSCPNSCISGPAMPKDSSALISRLLAVKKAAGPKDFAVKPLEDITLKKNFYSFGRTPKTYSEEDIAAVLAKIGKTRKEDELNCSSCGYATCRDKAKAVLAGKANLEMCLPFLMEKAKSFSNSIVSTSLDPILVLDEDLKIQLANPAIVSLVGLQSEKDLLGKPVSSLMDESLFALALGGENTLNKKVYWPDYDKVLQATVTYDAQYHILIGIFRDVSAVERQRSKQAAAAEESAKITSDVIAKNMRTVQEIAQLLGESTAETKVALSQLKDAIKKAEDDE